MPVYSLIPYVCQSRKGCVCTGCIQAEGQKKANNEGNFSKWRAFATTKQEAKAKAANVCYNDLHEGEKNAKPNFHEFDMNDPEGYISLDNYQDPDEERNSTIIIHDGSFRQFKRNVKVYDNTGIKIYAAFECDKLTVENRKLLKKYDVDFVFFPHNPNFSAYACIHYISTAISLNPNLKRVKLFYTNHHFYDIIQSFVMVFYPDRKGGV